MMIRVVLGALTVVSLSLGLLLTYAREPGQESVLTARVEEVDDALGRGAASAAGRVPQAAYVRALGTHRWEDMLAVGDASLRIRELTGARVAAAEARQAYLAALHRAEATGSADGALRVAEAFAALGDRDVAERCLVVAARLAADSHDAGAVERVRAATERLEERLRAEADSDGWHR